MPDLRSLTDTTQPKENPVSLIFLGVQLGLLGGTHEDAARAAKRKKIAKG